METLTMILLVIFLIMTFTKIFFGTFKLLPMLVWSMTTLIVIWSMILVNIILCVLSPIEITIGYKFIDKTTAYARLIFSKILKSN
jgi:hypothetical protein